MNRTDGLQHWLVQTHAHSTLARAYLHVIDTASVLRDISCKDYHETTPRQLMHVFSESCAACMVDSCSRASHETKYCPWHVPSLNLTNLIGILDLRVCNSIHFSLHFESMLLCKTWIWAISLNIYHNFNIWPVQWQCFILIFWYANKNQVPSHRLTFNEILKSICHWNAEHVTKYGYTNSRRLPKL